MKGVNHMVSTAVGAARKPSSLPMLRKRIKHCRSLYLFLLLPLAYIFVYHYIPMYGSTIAFKDFRVSLGIMGSEWVGLKHFERFFADFQFSRIIRNTISISLYNILAGFPVTIITALSINAVRGRRYKKTVQMITYMPYFISTVVMVGILMQMFSPKIGVLSIFTQYLTGSTRDLLSVPGAFYHIYVWSGLWQHVGWGTIIYIAALAAVDPALHEAAIIDGASRIQRMFYIELPAILPTATILLILNTGAIMNVGFEKAFLMQNSLNLSASEVISTYVYKQGIAGTGRNAFSYAAAIGLFNSVINFILVVGVNQFSKLIKQETLW